MTPNAERKGLSNAESDRARDKKAKDWVGTERIWTIECLKTSKLHNSIAERKGLSLGTQSGDEFWRN